LPKCNALIPARRMTTARVSTAPSSSASDNAAKYRCINVFVFALVGDGTSRRCDLGCSDPVKLLDQPLISSSCVDLQARSTFQKPLGLQFHALGGIRLFCFKFRHGSIPFIRVLEHLYGIVLRGRPKSTLGRSGNHSKLHEGSWFM